jgi:uncharacterized phage-associated protein
MDNLTYTPAAGYNSALKYCLRVHQLRWGAVMPHSADAIANYFLDRAGEDGKQLTPMHIQKLVYYAHAWHLAVDVSGRPLIDEPLEAWNYGPVIRSLYREFKDFGDAPITRRAMEIDPNTLDLVAPSVDSEIHSGLDPDLVNQLLNRVWQIYKDYTAIQLSNSSHEHGEPWRQIWERHNRKIPRAVHIPNELIRRCFLAKLQRN